MGSRTSFLTPVIVTAIAINAVVLAAALALASSDAESPSMWRLLGEDGLVEWMQFLCFTVLSGLLGFIAMDKMSRQPRISLEVLGIIGLTVLVALAALEEISWFQRLLGIDSPEFFKQNNKQFETNLHNLALGGASLHKTILVKLIFVVGITHNVILPLVARTRPAVKSWVESLGIYLPPLPAAYAYLLLVLLSHLLIDHPRKGELSEMFGAVHYLSTAFMAYMIGLGYGRPAVIDNQADSRKVSTLFAMLLVFLLFVSWLLGSTYNPQP
ncbi:hypothetical protein RY831_28680 [Noviherbaspirillum sp. CPCC 100848]|uniref:Uncharacterized protein n=1 Tax=Noviherbaspirillum album TaxID=3080276 RepID=A0ABU6JHK8_9BURK|nr:hypothetical protein [Noviherbaspirillum sp. CPCC 100848]MEC4723139.1 hypothetical protein [Noviherbaspirillum sp. CPCC 100848]